MHAARCRGVASTAPWAGSQLRATVAPAPHGLPTLGYPKLGRSSKRSVRVAAESLFHDDGGDEDNAGSGHMACNSVFTFTRWSRHRETSRYFRHLRGLLSSTTFRSLAPPLSYLTVSTTLLCAYQDFMDRGMLPPLAPVLHLTDGPFELTSFALSLLLVFRTDTSYARWNEALSTWSDVRNTSKELVRDTVCWIKDEALREVVVRWIIAFSKSLKVYVRENDDVNHELGTTLAAHEQTKLAAAHNFPHYTLQVLTKLVERARLSEIREEKLLSSLSRLNVTVGVCEKILRYPIPLSYTRHTSRFMLIWLCLLPLAMWDDAGWAVVPIDTTIAFLLLGIEEIGVQIEEPFALLPLEDIVKDIEYDITAIMNNKDDVTDLIAESLGRYHSASVSVDDDGQAAAGALDPASWAAAVAEVAAINGSTVNGVVSHSSNTNTSVHSNSPAGGHATGSESARRQQSINGSSSTAGKEGRHIHGLHGDSSSSPPPGSPRPSMSGMVSKK